MKTALICIAKNEDHYIDEWLRYHLKLGFSRIFVYQNDWRYTGDKTQYSDEVEWIEFDGEAMQMKAYNDFIDRHWKEYDFAAFFDVDEFLCLKKSGNVDSFFEQYKMVYAIGVNWRVFGDNGLERVENGEYSLLKRFTKGQKTLDRHIKTIINLKKSGNSAHFVNPHFVDRSINEDFTVSADLKNFIRGPWNYGCTCDSAQINHYHSKTKQEFMEKMARGKADTPLKNPGYNYKDSDFMIHNFSEIEDLAARDFMYRQAAAPLPSAQPEKTPKKVLFIQSFSKNIYDLNDLTFNNHIRYFNRHGYSFLFINEPYNAGLFRFSDVKKYLKDYDYVVTLGCDCLITNMDMAIEDFSDKYLAVSQESAFSASCGTYCNGEILIFNKKDNKIFSLLDVLDQLQQIQYDGYNASAFQKLIIKFFSTQTFFNQIYQSKHPLLDYIDYLDVGRLQSYIGKYVKIHVTSEEEWKPGRFLVHMFGIPNQDKVKYISEFLNEHPEYR